MLIINGQKAEMETEMEVHNGKMKTNPPILLQANITLASKKQLLGILLYKGWAHPDRSPAPTVRPDPAVGYHKHSILTCPFTTMTMV
jgi:hypothetical protein